MKPNTHWARTSSSISRIGSLALAIVLLFLSFGTTDAWSLLQTGNAAPQAAEGNSPAQSYVDLPLPELRSAVRELKGLEPASGQERLNPILQRVGEECNDLLQHTPNVIAREDVTTVIPTQPHAGFSMNRLPGVERQTFEYLVISRQTSNGPQFQEYRTLNGKPMKGADAWVRGTLTEGFVTSWLSLSSGNQSQSRFRYLGQQELENRKTFVLAFAQIPEQVESPAKFLLEGTSIPMLFQGIVWIDSTNYEIVRMREDLLGSLADASLKKFTVKILLGEVRIPDAHLLLWLPQDVDIEWEFGGRGTIQRNHHYSKYRLYTATTRILAAEP